MSRRRPQRQSRREREERSRRTERLVIGGAVAVLAVAAVLVVAGLILTEYLPPRAHVLTVGGRDYDAAAYVRRARYEIAYGRTSATIVSGEPAVTDTVGLIRDGEVVRLQAPEEVGEVTDDDIDAKLREDLGFVGSDDEAGFADAYANVLGLWGLGREEYEELLRVEMLRERLRDQFRDEVGEGVEQFRVTRLRLITEAQVEEVRARLADGEDFAALVEELGGDQTSGSSGDLGWRPLELLPEAARDTIAGLEVGEVSAVVEDGLFFDLYLLEEHEADRPLEDNLVALVVETRLNNWIAARRDSVVVELDMSGGERDWIDGELVDWLVGLQSGG